MVDKAGPRSRLGIWIAIVTTIVILIGGVLMVRNGHYGWNKHTITSRSPK